MTLMGIEDFVATAAKLYGLIVPIVGGLAYAGWWLRGFKADVNEERLRGTAETNEARLRGTAEANEAALKGQMGILEQRLALATEQQAAAEREGQGFQKELAELKEKMADDTTLSEDIRRAVTNLDFQLGKLLAANNATTTTLTSPGLWQPPAHLTQFSGNEWLETERKK
jgi:hypothetical protein